MWLCTSRVDTSSCCVRPQLQLVSTLATVLDKLFDLALSPTETVRTPTLWFRCVHWICPFSNRKRLIRGAAPEQPKDPEVGGGGQVVAAEQLDEEWEGRGCVHLRRMVEPHNQSRA